MSVCYQMSSQNFQENIINSNKQIPHMNQMNSTTNNFYSNHGSTLGSDFIYDETYKSYKIKQKFEKDPKYSYFNAVMQMKHKLSNKQQLYKSVFEAPDADDHHPKEQEYRKTFYSKTNQSMFDPETDIVKVERLKRNSFRIVKEQPSIDTLAIMKKNQSLSQVTSQSRPSWISRGPGHRSNMSLYEKPTTTQVSFEMTSKARNNKSYVELEVTESQLKPSSYQPSNPKPRLDEIMQEYRKMNRHSHYQKSRKSTLPKEFIEKLYQTNRMFYSKDGNRKRVSLY